jgi:ubiquinone biosynthesis protein UbiJ
MSAPTPPELHLGPQADDGIAPSVFALVERGANRRPALAREARGVVELRFSEDLAAVRISFGGGEILVEDVSSAADAEPVDLVVSGRLPDIIRLSNAPTMVGVPSPVDARGRAVLGQLARGRLKIEGDRALGRRLVALLRLD